ncbi:hypothetical protein BGW80DRAFT_816133 [Lactifluus volemus]|nr:hypothetical protein BGW80DRAFT_816133 [Lactifluus volemus]
MDDLSIGSNSKNIIALQQKESQQVPKDQVFQRTTIGSLPDNVLIEIFDFYQVVINEKVLYTEVNERPWDWEKLVHVCRRWRYIIFESPIRLNLQLFCTEKSPVRKLLDIWPPFPLVIQLNHNYSYLYWLWKRPEDCIDSTDNLVAALEHRDRVRKIQVYIPHPPDRLCKQFFTAMEVSLPALRSLSFRSIGETTLLPDTLLNGSAPCLRDLTLSEISFPSLPLLLSSTSDLKSLNLDDIPGYGYISPETMAASLSALPKLECLIINFKYKTPRLNRALPVPTRFVLPALTRLEFKACL